MITWENFLLRFKEGKRNISNCAYGNMLDKDVKTHQAQRKTTKIEQKC